MSSLPALIAALAVLQQAPVSGPDIAPMSEAGAAIAREEQSRLNGCLQLVESNPETAYEIGLGWLMNGNRPPARYCTAMALVALEQFEEGASRLEALAEAPDAGPMEDRVLYLAQAGNAWLAGGYPEAALGPLDTAIRLAPGAADLYLDRGAAHLVLENWDLAIGDLDTALGLSPEDPEALRLRAEAHLRDEAFEAALRDVEAARRAAPEDIDLLVLRGEIREAIRLSGMR